MMKFFSINGRWQIILLISLNLFIACSHRATTVKRDYQKIRRPKVSEKKKALNVVKKEQPPAEDITITMNFQGAKLSDVLKVMAQEFKANLVVPDDNKSRVTVFLYNANLCEALDMILSSFDYSYYRKGQTFLILKSSEKVSKVYRLKYAKASEVQLTLEGMSERANIKADELTNSIVVTDIVGNIKNYDEIIKELDSFQPSVMIEAEIFEVALDNLRNIGIEWGADYNHNEHQLNVQSPFASSLTNLFLSYKNLKSAQVQLMLNALRKDTESHLLSSPRIVTMNGQEAKILVGERVPYVKASTATSAGAVLQEVEFVDVGILLKVTPRILVEEELIFIDVQPEVSEVMDMEVQGVPRIGTREASTRVAIKNGETIVIAGLIKKDAIQANSSLPLLGRIPLLNWLFKSSNDTRVDRELIVFITPHILTREHYNEMSNEKNRIEKKLNSVY